jgi:AcrR family transcriptional regulator
MKDEIAEVALKQFLKVGVREMSISKLIEKLGISTKTVYKYFKNKEDLLEEALLLFYANEYRELDELSTDENAVHLLLEIWYKAVQVEYDLNNLLFQDLRYYYPELLQRVNRIISNKFEEKFVQIIEKGIKEDHFQNNIVPEVVMASIYTLYIKAFRTEDFKRFNISSFDLYLNTILIYIKGLCTQNGLKELQECTKKFKPMTSIRSVKNRSVVVHS